MVGSIRQGAALLAAMVIFFGAWVGFTSYAEHVGNPAVAAAGISSQPTGNMEGKEVRFGDTQSALYNIASTQTSTGSVDGANDSYTPMGGFGLLTGMMLGEVTPGGTGSGLYTILHLRHHRGVHRRADDRANTGVPRQEDPGQGGEARRTGGPGHAASSCSSSPASRCRSTPGRAGPLNAGPHGFTEILYALTSQANNNGSAFAGLTGNTAFYNVVGGIDMLLGRFGIMIPALALAGSLAAKNVVARVPRDVPHRQRHVRRPDDRRDPHHRRPHLLPGRLARPDRRAAQPREVLLMETSNMTDHRTRRGAARHRTEPTVTHGVAQARSLFDRRDPGPGARRLRSRSWTPASR